MANRSDTPPEPQDRQARAADPVLRRSRGFSLVWLIPLVAVGIGLWLAWTTFAHQGPVVRITFATAEGLEAGQTRVRYREVEVGMVEDVRVLPDLSGIVVEARLEPEFAEHLTEGTRFWVVRPRVGFAGVTGLGTLLSGAYLEVDPGPGASARSFLGLEEPPLIRSGAEGREFLLIAEDLGSVSRGAPVYYRGFPVGQVLGYRLADDARRFEIPVFVQSPYDRLVSADSRFWDVSGIRVDAGLDGIRVQVAGLAALIAGGVEFSSPAGIASEPADAGNRFALYPDEASIGEARPDERIPYVIEFEGSARGLRSGAAVEFRGIRVGSVEQVTLVREFATGRAPIRVYVNLEPQHFVQHGEALDEVEPDDIEAQYGLTAEAVARGLRAQLKTANILTGELYIELDFFDDAAPAGLERVAGVAVLPAVPTDLEALTATLSGLLDRFAGLPFEEITMSVAGTARRLEELATSPEIAAGIEDLLGAGAELRVAVGELGAGAGTLVGGAEATLRSLRAAIDQSERALGEVSSFLGEGSTTRFQIERLLQELSTAARSIRSFADSLERDPSALIRGRRDF